MELTTHNTNTESHISYRNFVCRRRFKTLDKEINSRHEKLCVENVDFQSWRIIFHE